MQLVTSFAKKERMAMEDYENRTPEQIVEFYQGGYLSTMNLETATRIIKSDMTNMARTCVSIGFHLKAVRDKELFREDGYESLWEYAADQFGLSMSSASRYISINDQFSVGGNTPQLQEEYRNFSKSQLQEMITMSGEQRQQVTEDMTVKEIRQMKNPEPVEQPAHEEEEQIPGQMEIEDYPEVLPEESVATSQMDDVAVSEEATSEKEVLSAYGLPLRTYPPDSLIATSGCGTRGKGELHDCFSCHMDGCRIRQEECCCVEAPMGNPFPCTILAEMEDIREELGDQCQFVNHDLAYRRAGDQEPVPCCKECENLCAHACSRTKKALDQMGGSVPEPEQADNVIDGEYRDIKTSEKEELFEETTDMTDLELAKAELEKSKEFLTAMLKCYAENDRRVRKQKVIVAALAGFICDLDLIENPPEKPEQPELPVMRNNDQRKEWLRNYRSWGLWYEDANIGAKYYKYEFENGATLIAEEYDFQDPYAGAYTTSYLHLVGGPESPKHASYGFGKWQRNERYNRYPNNETELVEFLKYVQKGGKV